MKTITVNISDSCYAALLAAAAAHVQQPEDFGSEIITSCLQGEDARREIRRLRDDVSVLAQAVLVITNVTDAETARRWVNEELRLDR